MANDDLNDDRNDELTRLVREEATRHLASEKLRAKVRTQIALAEAGRSDAPPRAARWAWPGGISWATLGAGFAAGLLVASFALPLPLWRGSAPGDAPHDALAAELVAQHVHALRDGPLTQVASNDRHNVKPWFQGKLDFAPPVIDLADEGFVLLGGRVEARHGRDVAVLVYQRRLHVIELFVWPAESVASAGGERAEQAPRSQSERGFQLVTWADRAMQYGAVSDAERAELERFSRLWRERLPAP